MGFYKLANQAENDIIRIYQYGVYQYGEAKADQYLLAFYDQFERIANNPYLYPPADDIRNGYRHALCGVDIIYFTITGDMVKIVAIVGQQGPEDWF